MQSNKKIVLFIGDLVAIFTSFFISLRIGYLNEFNPGVYKTHIGPFLIIYGLWIVMLFAFEMYEPKNFRPSAKTIKNIVISLSISLLISIAFFYIFDIFGISPKTNLLINISIFALFFIIERRFITNIFSKKFKEKIILIGKEEFLLELENAIKSQKSGYYEIAKREEFLDKETIKNINSREFDIVVFSPEIMEDIILSKNIQNIIESGINIMTSQKAYEKILAKIPSEQINEIWFITNIQNSKNIFYETVKRFFEVALAGSMLIILSPVFLIIFLLMKIEDGGPFLYSQTRTGLNGKNFKIHKIRSMITESEKNGPQWAKEKDARVTKIGKFLRASHLDESMQLINMINGEISLVGPRPERPEIIKDLVPNIKNYNLRHIVKPGITGWAQINYKYGNSIEDSRQKFEYDLYYVKNKNVFLDIMIIIRTIQKVFLK